MGDERYARPGYNLFTAYGCGSRRLLGNCNVRWRRFTGSDYRLETSALGILGKGLEAFLSKYLAFSMI